MKKRNTKIPSANPVANVDCSLHLIGEELKTRKFFNTLREAGIEDCYLQPDLGTLILKSLGIDDGKDETFYYYSDLMDHHAKKITADARSINKQAINVYKQLVKKK
jgi:hypothetical protein